MAKTRPRLATLGHEMLTSTPTTAVEGRALRAARRPRRRTRRSSRRRSTPARGRRPTCSHAQVVLDEGVDPGPLQPDRVEHPARGLGHPRRAAPGPRGGHHRLRDERAQGRRRRRTGAAPCRSRRSRTPSSAGWAARRPRASTLMSDHQCHRLRRRADGVGRARGRSRSRRRPTAPGRRGTPAPRRTSGPSGSSRPEPVTGMTHVMHTPTPQAIDSSTATCATAPCAGGDLGDRARASPSGRSRRRRRPGCSSMTSGSTSLTQPRVPADPSSVVTVRPSAAAPRLDDAEQPVLARRAEHHLDVAPPWRRAARPARTAARSRSRRRRARTAPARSAAGTACRAVRRCRPRRAARSRVIHVVPGPWAATTMSTVPP